MLLVKGEWFLIHTPKNYILDSQVLIGTKMCLSQIQNTGLNSN